MITECSRKDSVAKVLNDQLRRDKDVSLELIGGICEISGMNCQLAEVDTQYVTSIESPAVLMVKDKRYFYGLIRRCLFLSVLQRISRGSLSDLLRWLVID